MKLLRVLHCKLCNSTIDDTSMCSYQCEQDTVRPKSRPPGTVEERIYRMELIETREYGK